MKHVKLIVAGLLLTAVSVLAFAGVARAQSVKTGDSVTVPTGETVDSMLFAAGNNIDIAGDVNGDVYCAGQNITITGTIHGDVFCAGQNVSMKGTVDGSVRLAGQSVTIDGKVDGSAAVGAQTFLLEKNAVITKDVLGGSRNATINGVIKRDLAVGGNDVTVNGKIGRNVKGRVDNLTVGSTGTVGGDIEYTSKNNPVVDDGGKVAGKVTVTAPKENNAPRYVAPLAFSFVWFIYLFISVLVLALALALLFPSILHDASKKALKAPGKTALIGLIAIFVAPVLIIALLVTVIGIPLGLLALLIWILIVTLSGPFSAYTLGRVLMKDSKSPVLIMLLGASLLLLLYFIPILGLLAMFAAYLFGVGMILEVAMRRLPKPDQKVS